ncbi:expressed unknown protein [Seminavis robusta]|uniref:Trichome birefringence-like C-terminal domain-containing protein n=1 Tax=Seminavis robusta TaxID=568900 RepID=A0A9N8DW61_9STRA|nr:expressed unknown protein [Seminavis robusta]|eukprot:Sro340_g121200.1 n/a (455) ;mRNA; r:22643-24007
MVFSTVVARRVAVLGLCVAGAVLSMLPSSMVDRGGEATIVVAKNANFTDTAPKAAPSRNASVASHSRTASTTRRPSVSSPKIIRQATPAPTHSPTQKPSDPAGQQQQQKAITKTQCAVERDDTTNTFSFRGNWVQNASLAAALDRKHQAFGCKKRPLLPPYEGMHGCCSQKGTDYLQATFCPGVDTTSAVHSFLQATRHKTVLFLGDSLTLQSFAAVGMAMRALQIPFQYTTRDNHLEQSYHVPSTDTTVTLRELYRLEDVDRSEWKFNEPDSGYHLRDITLKAVLQKVHILISNFGLHHWPMPEYHYRQYKHVQELVQQENNNRRRRSTTSTGNDNNNNQICLLWRRTLPQHFASKTGGGEWGDRLKDYGPYGCVALNRTWTHPSDKALARIQNELFNASRSIPTLDFTSILEDAHAFYSRRKGVDCTHMCYSPLIWDPILHVTAHAIEQSCQ